MRLAIPLLDSLWVGNVLLLFDGKGVDLWIWFDIKERGTASDEGKEDYSGTSEWAEVNHCFRDIMKLNHTCSLHVNKPQNVSPAQWLFSVLHKLLRRFTGNSSSATNLRRRKPSERRKRNFFFYVRERRWWVCNSVTPPGNPLRTLLHSPPARDGGGVNSSPSATRHLQPAASWPFGKRRRAEAFRLLSYILIFDLVMVGSTKGPSFRPSPHLRPGRSWAGETPPSPSPRFSSSPTLVIKRPQLRDRGLRKMMKLFSRLSLPEFFFDS